MFCWKIFILLIGRDGRVARRVVSRWKALVSCNPVSGVGDVKGWPCAMDSEDIGVGLRSNTVMEL